MSAEDGPTSKFPTGGFSSSGSHAQVTTGFKGRQAPATSPSASSSIQTGRTMAKQMAARVEAATAPFQYALTTKAGCESVAQSLTDQDERATIVSIGGVGAYDFISRNAMLEGLATVPEGDRLLPFLRLMRRVRHIGSLKARVGGTLRPPHADALQFGDAPSSDGGSGATQMVSESSHFWTTCASCVTRKRWKQLSAPLQRSCGHTLRSQVHDGKTQVWNRAGEEPAGMHELTIRARRLDPDAVVWRGDFAPFVPAP